MPIAGAVLSSLLSRGGSSRVLGRLSHCCLQEGYAKMGATAGGLWAPIDERYGNAYPF